MEYIKSENGRFSHELISKRRTFTPFHYHDDYELYLLLAGDTKYFVDDEIFHLHKGNLIFIPKKTFHKTDSEQCLHNERILISFGDNVFDDDMLPILDTLTKNKLICLSENKLLLVRELLNKIDNEHQKNRIHKDLIIQSYIREILILLCRYKKEDINPTSETDNFIYNISEYISNNITENITLNSLSKKFAMSEAHLSRKFKSVLGTGLNEYIRYVRILNAEKLLTDTQLSITEIAEKCGFNDSNYFSTIFKKTIGTTPHKYRKNHE